MSSLLPLLFRLRSVVPAPTMKYLAARPSVLIDSTLTLLIVNACWASVTENVLSMHADRTAQYDAPVLSSSVPLSAGGRALRASTIDASAAQSAVSGNETRSERIRKLADRIKATASSAIPSRSIRAYNAGHRGGWIVQRSMLDVKRRHYAAADLVGGNSVKAQEIALLASLDTSSGHAQGQILQGGPGTNLVIVPDYFRNLLLKVDWYNMTQLLRPADFMQHREHVFNRALRIWSTTPILRDLWSVVVWHANNLLDDTHKIGSEASVRVLQTIMQFNFLSIQKSYRTGGLNAIPDHFHKNALRQQLRPVPLTHAPELNMLAKSVGVSATSMQHYLFAQNVSGGGAGGGGGKRSRSADDSDLSSRQRAALTSATGSLDDQAFTCDYTITLESADHGLVFSRSDRFERRRQRIAVDADGLASASAGGAPSSSAVPASSSTAPSSSPVPAVYQCVVARLPTAASESAAPLGKGVTVRDALAVSVGDVVMKVSYFPSKSDTRAARKRVDLDPAAFLVDEADAYV